MQAQARLARTAGIHDGSTVERRGDSQANSVVGRGGRPGSARGVQAKQSSVRASCTEHAPRLCQDRQSMQGENKKAKK